MTSLERAKAHRLGIFVTGAALNLLTEAVTGPAYDCPSAGWLNLLEGIGLIGGLGLMIVAILLAAPDWAAVIFGVFWLLIVLGLGIMIGLASVSWSVNTGHWCQGRGSSQLPHFLAGIDPWPNPH